MINSFGKKKPGRFYQFEELTGKFYQREGLTEKFYQREELTRKCETVGRTEKFMSEEELTGKFYQPDAGRTLWDIFISGKKSLGNFYKWEELIGKFLTG